MSNDYYPAFYTRLIIMNTRSCEENTAFIRYPHAVDKNISVLTVMVKHVLGICLMIRKHRISFSQFREKVTDIKETPFNNFADDMPMYLLDVRHMTREKLDSYSPALRAFFGFLVYENKAELNEFVRENDESFNNLPEQTIDALIEITHSEELERFKKEYRTPEGGVNVCYGIQVYGNQREMAGIVRHAQKHGFSIAETVKDIMSDYMLKEKDAKEVVEKYWKKEVGTSETK